MSPRLTILTGALAGRTHPVGASRISLGRDAGCEIRFDPERDAEVSARHAEIRVERGTALVHDANSTNGTYVNDRRISGEQSLHDGDEIRLGANGPRLRFETGEGAKPARGRTSERIAVAVRQQTRGLRIAVAALAVLAIAAAGAIALSGRRAESAPEPAAVTPRMDFEGIARANGPAVVMVAAELPDGRSYSGTGFGVGTDGSIVTNRHLVQGEHGELAKRIAVIYADTRDWLPAHVERVASDADLALLRLDAPESHPVVRTIASAPPAVGAPVAVIGYPQGVASPMEGSGTAVTARTTFGVGTVAKSIPATLQIDAFAIEGSSGSPVFGADGAVVGVVYGGEPESRGRMVYAVPAAAVRDMLRP